MANKIRAALIGFGGMGHFHASCYAKQKNVELVAICDIDKKKLEQEKEAINLGESGKTDLSRVAKYTSYEEMKAKEQFDMLDICLPGYLGTSQYQSDHCAFLRSIYGEGEAGWLKFMQSCLPVLPSDWGNMGMRDGKARTQLLASKFYTSHTKTDPTPLCPAAYYAANIETATLPKGTFSLGTTEEVFEILDGIKYGTNGSRDADKVNALQNHMGKSAISNGSYLWSCLRLGAGLAWIASGGNGFFYSSLMYSALVVVPVAHLKLSASED